jgi:hypothetical protein
MSSGKILPACVGWGWVVTFVLCSGSLEGVNRIHVFQDWDKLSGCGEHDNEHWVS